MEAKKVKLTLKEEAAIEALRSAIKALPRTIYFSLESFGDGTIDFWKRTGPGEARGVSKPLRCKRAFEL